MRREGSKYDQDCEEADELGGGVPSGDLPQHCASLRVEGRVQAKHAMSDIFESVSLSPSGRERKDWIEPNRELEWRCFVNAKTATCAGGLRMTSAALVSKLGSSEVM